jgi:preprotein translocase subunit SecD
MRKKGVWPLIGLVIVAFGALIATLVVGHQPNLGLDLQGGVSVVLQPVREGKKQTSVSPEVLNQTKQIIETRVNAMIEIWGITAQDADKLVQMHIETKPDAHLLNGPAKDGEGVAQDDIDRLLNGADGDASGDVTAMPAGPASQDDIDALFK